MLKIRALNRELSSDEDAPTVRREAQVRSCLIMFRIELIYFFAGGDSFGLISQSFEITMREKLRRGRKAAFAGHQRKHSSTRKRWGSSKNYVYTEILVLR